MDILGIMWDKIRVVLCRWYECHDECIDSLFPNQNWGVIDQQLNSETHFKWLYMQSIFLKLNDYATSYSNFVLIIKIKADKT